MEENRNEELREETSEENMQEDPAGFGEASAGTEGADPDRKTSESAEVEASAGMSQEASKNGGDGRDEDSASASDEAEDGQEEDSQSGATEDVSGEGSDPENGESSDDGDTESQGQDGNVRRGLFGKKKKDKRDQQIEELTDRVQRQMAEFDNFRKRSEKEKSAMYEIGAKSVIEKILPTIDNFERGFAGLSEEQKEDPFVQGMEKVYRQMLTTLEGIGVTALEAVGKPFDPNFHNAVMHVEDEEAGENTVVEEFQKGYLYHDSVVRHSMVKVAN